MKNRNAEIPPSERFVKCPMDLLLSDLPPHALKLWLILKSHCINDATCHPSVSRLTQLMGVTRKAAMNSLAVLEKTGYLTVSRKSGCGNVYTPKLPDLTSDRSFEPNQCSLLHPSSLLHQSGEGTSVVNYTGPVYSTTPDQCSLLHPEIDKGNRLPEIDLANTPKSKSRIKTKAVGKTSKSRPPKDPAVLQAMLDEIDLAPFQTKFPGIDLDSLWERFTEVTLTGTAQKPGPNPYGYRDLKLAFRNWCRKEAERSDSRQQPEPVTSPAHRRFA